MADASRLKRPLLYALVGSVVLAVGLGMVLVLRNDWGWFELRVMFTTITIGAASICGMACDVSRARKGLNLLPGAGVILTLAATVLILYGMWTDSGSDSFWKMTVSVAIFAVATAHACLISVARLARRFRIVLAIAYQVIFGLAALLVGMIVFEHYDTEMFQVVAAVSILDAGLTVLMPILHRISRTDPTTEQPLTLLDERSVAVIDGEIALLKKRLGELEKLRAELTHGH